MMCLQRLREPECRASVRRSYASAHAVLHGAAPAPWETAQQAPASRRTASSSSNSTRAAGGYVPLPPQCELFARKFLAGTETAGAFWPSCAGAGLLSSCLAGAAGLHEGAGDAGVLAGKRIDFAVGARRTQRLLQRTAWHAQHGTPQAMLLLLLPLTVSALLLAALLARFLRAGGWQAKPRSTHAGALLKNAASGKAT